MEELYKLPNGQRMFLSDIRMVRPREALVTEYTILGNAVEIQYGQADSHCMGLPFDSYAEAQAYADELAGLVNDVRGSSAAINAVSDQFANDWNASIQKFHDEHCTPRDMTDD